MQLIVSSLSQDTPADDNHRQDHSSNSLNRTNYCNCAEKCSRNNSAAESGDLERKAWHSQTDQDTEARLMWTFLRLHTKVKQHIIFVYDSPGNHPF